MTNQTVDEHITLYSPGYSEQIETPDLNQVTLELLQTSKVREYQKLFRVFDNKLLAISEITPRHHNEYTIPLSLLDENATSKWIIKFRYLLLAGLFILLAWTNHTLMSMKFGIFNNPNMYAVTVLLTTMGAILLVYMIRQSRHVLLFKSKHGRIPLIEVRHNNPDKQRFRQFSRQLANLITQCDTSNYFTPSQILAAELSEHRRLRDEGLLTDKQYQQVKQHFMDFHSRSAQQPHTDTIH
ncbi:MAG: hypothetical protein PVG89_04315 [Gammaproteobacteria bacterium]|jgi:hypothetical protein